MTNEEKQALIEWAHKWIEPARRTAENNPHDESAKASLTLYEIALYALTAQPVKIPDLRQSVSGDRYVWADGAFNYRNDVIAAIRAAGYEVQE